MNTLKLLIKNSFTTTQDISTKEMEVIAKALTYDDQEVISDIQQCKFQMGMAFRQKNKSKVAWFRNRMAELESKIKVCWYRDYQFPTGHLNIVQDALNASKIDFESKDLRKDLSQPIALSWAQKQPSPRYYQSEVLALATKEHRGVFESAVGSGKSRMMLMIAHALQRPVLIIVPSKDLATQTETVFAEAFGSKAVSCISSTSKLPKRLAPIRIANIQALTALRKKDALQDWIADIGVVFADEAHHLAASTATALLPDFDHVYYRFSFSGTFQRGDSKTLDMHGFTSKVLYRYSAAQATKEGYLTPLKVITHDIAGQRSSNYQTEYAKNYCENKELLLKIREILDAYVAADEQVLILVGRKEKSGAVIHKYLTSLGIDVEFVTGDSDRQDVKQALINFNDKTTRVLIGSSVLGEGIDIRSTNHLIMAQGGKGVTPIVQAVGRAVRLFPGKEVAILHDFRFENTRFLAGHLDQRHRIYDEYFAAEIVS